MHLLRPLLCAFVFAASIAIGWNFLVESLGQGSHVLVAGGFGILLGGMVIAMGLMAPVLGLGASFVVARLLRGPDTLRPEDPRSFHVHLAAQAAYPQAPGAAARAGRRPAARAGRRRRSRAVPCRGPAPAGRRASVFVTS